MPGGSLCLLLKLEVQLLGIGLSVPCFPARGSGAQGGVWRPTLSAMAGFTLHGATVISRMRPQLPRRWEGVWSGSWLLFNLFLCFFTTGLMSRFLCGIYVSREQMGLRPLLMASPEKACLASMSLLGLVLCP